MNQQNSKKSKSFGGGLKSVIDYNNSIKTNSELLHTLKIAVPQFFEKDVCDEDGNLIKNGDFKTDKFLDELKENNVTESRDGYKLGFVGKDYARLQTGRRSETMIVPDEKHNSQKENENSGNIFITGDNLEALRHLQIAYAGKIKMIYIDPPYNTGKEFTYNDTFEFTDEQLKSALGYDDNDIARLKSFQGKSSHSAWLTFMYPRLKLAQKLLTDDGVIFVSIDDNEQANLKLLMDDVFGEVNFVTEFIWEKKKKPSFLHNNVGKLGDYIICYLKDSNYTFPFSIETTTEGKKYPLNNAGNSLTKLIFPKGSVHFDIKDCLILPQDMSEGNIITKLITPLEIKNGCNNKEFILEGEWRYSQAKLNEIIDRKEKITISKIPFRPNHIKDGNEIKKMKNFLSPVHYSMETNEDATEQINELFQKDVFDNPKPTKLIKTFIKATTYLDKDSIILDFFAGSGTTAHAVIQLNDEDAENNGNRRFILVQIDEPTNPDSEARKAGYNTVDEIARERIKRAVKKIKTKKGLSLPKDFDYGFKHYRLVTPDVQTLDKIIEFDPENERLFGIDMIDQFSHKKTETSGLQTLLTTWLIDEGYPFDTKIETKKFADYESHYIEESATLYLINLGWNTKALEALLNEIGKNKLIVHTIIVYVYSFDFESMRELKTNIKTNLDTPPEIIERY